MVLNRQFSEIQSTFLFIIASGSYWGTDRLQSEPFDLPACQDKENWFGP